MNEPKVICKWKYKTLSPDQKYQNISNYIKYITKQVEERRANEGAFRFSSGTIGEEEHDKETLKEFDQSKYLSYINERKGSSSLFSDNGVDTDELAKSLNKYAGTAWIPIVSMKEKDAIEYELLTEAQWIAKGRELAEEYRKILGIPKDNFNWVAAFHTKPEPDQNKLADAGAMPHIHFIIWEKVPTRSRPNLSRDQMSNVRVKTANVLSKEYMAQQYAKRNELRAKLQSKAKDSLTTQADFIRDLVLDIRTVTGGKGKLTIGNLEKRLSTLERIEKKMSNQQPLTDNEKYFLQSNKVSNVKEIRQKIRNYNYILDKLDNIVQETFKGELNELLQEWLEVSEHMREAQGKSLSEETTFRDLEKISKTIQNGILEKCKDASLDNRFITPALKGMLIEKCQYGQFKRNLSYETIQTSLETFTQLYKSIGLEREEVFRIGQEILDRSNLEEYEAVLQDAIDKKYDEDFYLQYITTCDFWETVKAMQIPLVPKEFPSIYQVGQSSYQIFHNTVLQPQIKTFLDVAKTKTFLDDNFFNVITDSVPSLVGIYNSPCNNRDEYKETYTSLLEEYENLNQAAMDRQPIKGEGAK